MNENRINLSLKELNSLKIIGQGTDGIVCKYSNNILIKVYRKSMIKKNEFDKLMDAPDKIYDKNKLKEKKYNEQITLKRSDENEHIKIYTKDAINEVANRQKRVKRTKLPKGAVYADNRFAGCFLEKINGIQIHKLFFLPEKYKFQIVRNLILDVQELLKNNIYHVDLNNSPYCDISFFDENNELKTVRGHSHVLVNPYNRNTNLFDLDGKSAFYTDYYDEALNRESLRSLCSLLIEFLNDFLIKEEYYDDKDFLKFELIRHGINKELASLIANDNINSIDEIKKGLKI